MALFLWRLREMDGEMKGTQARKVIRWFSAVWATIAVILFGLAMGRILDLELFKWAFAVGFGLWSVVVFALSRLAYEDES